MTQVVTMSISVNISPIQDYIFHHIPPTYEMTPGFKPFTVLKYYFSQVTKEFNMNLKYPLLAYVKS